MPNKPKTASVAATTGPSNLAYQMKITLKEVKPTICGGIIPVPS